MLLPPNWVNISFLVNQFNIEAFYQVTVKLKKLERDSLTNNDTYLGKSWNGNV